MVNKAEHIYLDKKSRFYKRRLKTLKEHGYEVTKYVHFSTELTLTENG